MFQGGSYGKTWPYFSVRDVEIEEVAFREAPSAKRTKPCSTPRTKAKLGFLNVVALFSFCSVILMFAVPALIAALVLIFSQRFDPRLIFPTERDALQ